MDTFRKKYRELTVEESTTIENIKETAERLLSQLNEAVPAEERSEKSRCINVARTKLEEAIMWAVKGLTY